ncbi:hypothetical protein CPB83DRAFT_760772 [Crepidotus variabilis]|uniref:Tubulin-specific chaperone A n=1 Tax=Crepidotus variabilis TaxID=179855 RepID=A0A9P6JSE3_9AGAR|nr:hypothetical protein CPB83DRAFT_760772 [Crepidotus variabilis]
MSDVAAVRRQLKIKTGAAGRLYKETSLYRKEVLQLEAKRTKLLQDGAEDWDVKNAGKMMDESNKLVLDTEERLNKAKEELQALVVFASSIFWSYQSLIFPTDSGQGRESQRCRRGGEGGRDFGEN